MAARNAASVLPEPVGPRSACAGAHESRASRASAALWARRTPHETTLRPQDERCREPRRDRPMNPRQTSQRAAASEDRCRQYHRAWPGTRPVTGKEAPSASGGGGWRAFKKEKRWPLPAGAGGGHSRKGSAGRFPRGRVAGIQKREALGASDALATERPRTVQSPTPPPAPASHSVHNEAGADVDRPRHAFEDPLSRLAPSLLVKPGEPPHGRDHPAGQPHPHLGNLPRSAATRRTSR